MPEHSQSPGPKRAGGSVLAMGQVADLCLEWFGIGMPTTVITDF